MLCACGGQKPGVFQRLPRWGCSPAVGQYAFSLIPTLQFYSWRWLAESADKGVWEGTRLESLEDVVGNVSTTFIFKMLIKLIWIIDKYFLACQILTLQVCPLNSSPPSPVLPRECIPKTFSSAFMNGFEYLWHQFHVFFIFKITDITLYWLLSCFFILHYFLELCPCQHW